MTKPSHDLVDLLTRQADTHGDRVVYRYLADGEMESDRLTFGELDLRARALAIELLAHARPGRTVLLLYPPGLEFMVAFCGCLYAGLIAVPAYPPRPNKSLARIEAIVADAGAAVVLTTSKVLEGLKNHAHGPSALSELPCIATDRSETSNATLWKPPAIGPDSPAFLQYTSGSTAAPKGVIVGHGNILYNLEMIRISFGNGPETIGVGWLPMYHDMGLIGNMLEPIYLGIPCVLMPPLAFLQRPVRWLKAISRYRATTSGGPNFAYELCIEEIDEDEKAGLDLSSWVLAFNGAEPVRSHTMDRFAEAFAPYQFKRTAFYPCYGLAETTLLATGGLKGLYPQVIHVDDQELQAGRITPAQSEKGSSTLVSCGRTWLEQRVEIVAPETSLPCPEGTIGEIWIAGPNVAQGYWNRPEETERVFRAFTSDGEGPYLRTGDLGARSDDQIFVTGRLKDLIVIRGRNIYPHDIELCVEEANALLRRGCSAAFSIDIEGEERLVVVAEVVRRARRLVSNQDSSRDSLGDLARTIRKTIADQFEIQLYALSLIKPYSLPKTSSGKVRRFACRERFLAKSLEPVAEVTGEQMW